MIDGVHDYWDEYVIGRARRTSCSQPAATTPSPSKILPPPHIPIGHAQPPCRFWSRSLALLPPYHHPHPMEAKLKSLKVVDLKDILNKAGVAIPSKANKPDLIAKVLASPAAVDVYNQQHGGAPPEPAKNASKLASKPQATSEAPAAYVSHRFDATYSSFSSSVPLKLYHLRLRSQQNRPPPPPNLRPKQPHSQHQRP
ncbi:hypothetical protein C8Q79DRAFT_691307 [Trametes meyenii]|nr:hypothetical protein C8Q79DRAFT_691307 [Trametes meyenii]